MNDQEFSLYLSSFLDPAMVMESVRRYGLERKKALAPAALIVGSGHLTFGDEGHYAELVKQFLRGFRIPTSLDFILEAGKRQAKFLQTVMALAGTADARM
jgi:hypothetical protein